MFKSKSVSYYIIMYFYKLYFVKMYVNWEDLDTFVIKLIFLTLLLQSEAQNNNK